jgi:prolyl-tRNA editing enzyme YbaK/EbsC (Cys-tRNA(Pro) deacylase)
MGFIDAKEHLRKFDKEKDIIEFETSTATVLEAANALNIEPARIAKTLSFRYDDSCILVVMAGDARVDNVKFKNYFNIKARMLTAEEVFNFTGHQVGGVCPFGLKENIDIYFDESLKRFKTVYPACGNSNSCIELSLSDLEKITNPVDWIDISKL